MKKPRTCSKYRIAFVFLEASASKHAPEFPVRIVAFRGEKQHQPYHREIKKW